MNLAIKESLSERNLQENFEEFYQGRTFDAIGKNLTSLFSLLRSLDNMKSARISLESNSIKTLVNNVPEGIAIVNREKIVTHMNHTCERLLRLIPGEIIGQSLSRKITIPLVIESLERCLSQDQKIINEKIELKEDQIAGLSIFPVKNKFGETIRAVMMLGEFKNGK